MTGIRGGFARPGCVFSNTTLDLPVHVCVGFVHMSKGLVLMGHVLGGALIIKENKWFLTSKYIEFSNSFQKQDFDVSYKVFLFLYGPKAFWDLYLKTNKKNCIISRLM